MRKRVFIVIPCIVFIVVLASPAIERAASLSRTPHGTEMRGMDDTPVTLSGNSGTTSRASTQEPLALTYIANAGVMVTIGDFKVLIDALFDKPNSEYRAPAPGVLEELFTGEGQFDGVDLVLVTHNHPDHFDARLAVRYVETFAEPLLLAPIDAVTEMRRVATDWKRIEPRIIPLDIQIGEQETKDLKQVSVTAFRTLHSGDRESPMNIMYLFEKDGWRVFHEGDSRGKPEAYKDFGLDRRKINLSLVHYWFPLEPNCTRFLQEVLKSDHIALTHLPIRVEGDTPAKIEQVRSFYKDILLLMPGMPTRIFQRGDSEKYFGQALSGTEPVKFLPDVLTKEKHPHGQLTFSPDGKEVYWSAMLGDGPEQTIFFSTFDGKRYSEPRVAPFAADSGNGGPAFSNDGKRLFFSAQLPARGNSHLRPTAICYVERSGSGWTLPVTIEATVDTLMIKGQVSVARSGNIYFSGRVLTERLPAIFMCRYSHGSYLAPEKLGGPLATVPLLIDPWIDPEEKFLLVSCPPTEGPPILTDIGISLLQPDGGWTLPTRIGGGVNTPAFERFPSLSRDGQYLFFIRSFGERFVSDQAHFYWVSTKVMHEVKPKE